MHGDDELGQRKSTPLFRIGQAPYPAEDLVGQAGLAEDGPGLLAWQELAVVQVLSCKQGDIPAALFRNQLGNDITTGDLGRDGGRGLGWRNGSNRRDACELGEASMRRRLKCQLGTRLFSDLGMANEAKGDVEALPIELALVCYIGNLPYLQP